MKIKFLTIILLMLLSLSTYVVVPTIPLVNDAVETSIEDTTAMRNLPPDLTPSITKGLADTAPPTLPSDLNLNDFLADRENTYKITYEPWKSKAAIHAIAYDEETGFLALGGGYLYDNEVHLYRKNLQTGQFDKVFELGSGIIRSDVLSIDFGDTDLNSFLEIAVASADGHVYVFEQRHLYDPYANTENMFDLVWTSPGLFRVFAVKIDDVDRDYRPDIIAGSWDGKVHLYEYDTHSGYPFVEDHWIQYREVATLDVGGKVYSLETGDTNNNGLPEIVVGTREGQVKVFENAGTSLLINGQPFPLIRDNTYTLTWSSENYTWQPVCSIAVGELDGSAGDEIALVAEGQGVFTLDWNEQQQTYDYKKVQRDFADWETFGFHGLDYWVDSVVFASNVKYYDPINSSLVIDEPIEYTWNENLGIFLPNASVYPYNTGMAQATDGNFSTFISGLNAATAIVDFGRDEEGTGSANSQPDLVITFKNDLTSLVFTTLNFSIGQTPTELYQVDSSHFTIDPTSPNRLEIDVDDVLSEHKMDWFRYAQITVFNNATYSINSIELMQVYNLLTDAVALTIGPMKLNGDLYGLDETELNKIVVATVTGEFVVISYNSNENRYEISWESYDDERYTLGVTVWDIEPVRAVESAPIWMDIGNQNNITPSVGNYTSWTYGILSPITEGGDGSPYYIVGTDAGVIRALDMSGNEDPTMNGYLSSINTGSRKYTSAEVVSLWPNLLPVIVVSSFNPDADYGDPRDSNNRALIEFYVRTSSTSSFSYFSDIRWLDPTREISAILSTSKTIPKLSFADYDADGDLDMIISNGYVYLAKNLEKEFGYVSFMLQPDYFDSINRAAGSIVWGQPDMADIDQDGDLDLILSYASKFGVTCFLNKGTKTNPIWEEDWRLFGNSIPETSMATIGLTDARLVPNVGGYTHQRFAEIAGITLEGNYSFAAFHNGSGTLRWAIPFYNAMDSYLVATYPQVHQIDFCLMQGINFKNLGFHIRESWNTDFDLEDWTMTISSGDIDGDGKNELIVGDYDNNVYVFEHLRNNTYKRMFRSFDLNHSVTADTSPYAYQELEGISGEFQRKIWDHAKHILAGVDLDQDSLQEIVVASDLQFYIFEASEIDDTIRYAYSFDLHGLGYLEEESSTWKEVTEITALAGGIDLDNDGRLELVVAAGPFLFVFNVDKGSFEGMENNDIFGMNGQQTGRYKLLGNPESSPLYQNSKIQTLAVGDTDKDGILELLLGGVYDTSVPFPDGFVYIYECAGGTFLKVWEGPEWMTTSNPISSILITDQDYDGKQEIVIGHRNGIDVFEWIEGTDSQYQSVETITSSPSYPIVSLNSITLSYNETFSGRLASDFAWDQFAGTGYGWLLYVESNDLSLVRYDPSTDKWILIPDIFQPGLIYYPGGITIEYEEQPSILGTTDGTWFTWKAKRQGSSRTDFWISQFNYSTGLWEEPVWLLNDTDNFGHRDFPELFEYNSTHLGVLYRYENVDTSELYYILIRKDLTGPRTKVLLDYQGWSAFDVHKVSAVNLPDGSIAVAFSARYIDLPKGDYDIWVLSADSPANLNKAIPHQATSSFYDEIYPDIDYLRDDNHTLIIAYEQQGTSFEGHLGMVASSDNGATWSRESTLSPFPKDLTREYYSGHYLYYLSGEEVRKPMIYSPTIIGMPTSGFMYIAAFSIYDITNSLYNDILYGLNPNTQWVGNSLNDVSYLAAGDTDCDGRQEIIATFDRQFGVYELKNSTDGYGNMTYAEEYLSDELNYPITGVTVYDTNGNSWGEIGVSSKHGNVFLYEYRDPSHGATEFSASEITFNFTGYGAGIGGNIATGDTDGDSKNELLLNFVGGSMYLLDNDATVIWEVPSPAFFVSTDVTDLDGDSLPEAVCVQWGEEFLLAFNLTDGSLLWNFTSFSADISDLVIADMNTDGLPEIVLATDDGRIWVLHGNGTLWHVQDVDFGFIWGLTVGDFTNNTMLEVAYANNSKAVKVVNPFDGTVYYETPPNMVGSTFWRQPIVASDFNGDGYDDVIFGNDAGMRMADAMSGRIFYNSTVSSRLWDLRIADFDNDNVDELLVLTEKQGVYLVEKGTLRMQWHYMTDLGSFDHVLAVGRFGGTGGADIALRVNATILVVLDGKNGHPLWLNFTQDSITAMSALDFNGDGIDSLLTWRWQLFTNYSYLLGYERIPFESYVPKASYKLHEAYWTAEVTGINDMWAADVNDDGYDEVFVRTGSSTYLSMWDAYHGILAWNISFGGTINEVRFGVFQSGLDIDLAVLLDEKTIQIIDSETLNTIGTITAPSNYIIRDFVVANFDTTPYQDIAVLFETRFHTSAFVSWFGSDGSWKYNSQQNATDGYNYLVAGSFTGNGTVYDIAFGGKDNIVRVLHGDGSFVWSYTPFTDIDGLVAGYFDDDSYEDIAFRTSATVYVLNSSAQNLMYSLVIGADVLRGFYAADLIGDSSEELVLNLKNIGIQGYNSSGEVVWSLDAPLVYPTYYPWSHCAFADFDNDGKEDLVLTNAEYINVVSGATETLLWHFVSNEKIGGIIPGTFDGDTTNPDVLAYNSQSLWIVSGSLQAPSLPSSGTDVHPSAASSILLGAVIAGTPLCFILTVIVVRIKKRKPNSG